MSPLLTLIPVLVGPTAGQPQPLPVRLRDGRVGGSGYLELPDFLGSPAPPSCALASPASG